MILLQCACCSSQFGTVFVSESEAGVLCFLDSVSFFDFVFDYVFIAGLNFLFFCTAACPSGWCSCCCGCCTLHLENGLVANGDDDGVGVPVGAVGSLNLHLPLLACRFPLPLLHGLLPFLLGWVALPNPHVGWLDVWPRRSGACFALPSCPVFHS